MVAICTKKATYKDRYKSNFADELLRNNKYKEVYNKINKYYDEADILDFKEMKEIIYNKIDMKEYLILNMFNFCRPDELEQYILK
jgi:hypothetical protein